MVGEQTSELRPPVSKLWWFILLRGFLLIFFGAMAGASIFGTVAGVTIGLSALLLLTGAAEIMHSAFHPPKQ